MATKTKKIVVIRSGQSGVHAGELVSQRGDTVTLRNAIRLWRFVPVKMSGDKLASVSEVAAYGINRADERARTGARLAEIVVLGVCEIVTATREAARTLMVDP